MNEHAPPKKGACMQEHAPDSSHLNSAQNNRALTLTQDFCARRNIWRCWELEAVRLFHLFWQTADARHLRAFSQHVYSMRLRAGRRLP
jgi:hypothetical protein